MNLGKQIEAERKRRGWTQKHLCELVPGLEQQALDRLEKRDSKSSSFTLGIAAAFGMTADQLLSGAGAFAVRESEPAAYLPAPTPVLAPELMRRLASLDDARRTAVLRSLAATLDAAEGLTVAEELSPPAPVVLRAAPNPADDPGRPVAGARSGADEVRAARTRKKNVGHHD